MPHTQLARDRFAGVLVSPFHRRGGRSSVQCALAQVTLPGEAEPVPQARARGTSQRRRVWVRGHHRERSNRDRE